MGAIFEGQQKMVHLLRLKGGLSVALGQVEREKPIIEKQYLVLCVRRVDPVTKRWTQVALSRSLVTEPGVTSCGAFEVIAGNSGPSHLQPARHKQGFSLSSTPSHYHSHFFVYSFTSFSSKSSSHLHCWEHMFFFHWVIHFFNPDLQAFQDL